MNDSNESSISISPSQLLTRLNALRKLQEAAREKLLQQRLYCRQKSFEITISETSHAPDSHTGDSSQQSYAARASQNALQSLLSSYYDSPDNPEDKYGQPEDKYISRPSLQRIRSCEQIDGVTELNLSLESEFLISPSSGVSKISHQSGTAKPQASPSNITLNQNTKLKKSIGLDEIPILTPQKDFETMLMEKIKSDQQTKKHQTDNILIKRPFLKRGQGLLRFGMKKDHLVIQNTKSLPWKNCCNVQKNRSNTLINTSPKLDPNCPQIKISTSNKTKATSRNTAKNDKDELSVTPKSILNSKTSVKYLENKTRRNIQISKPQEEKPETNDKLTEKANNNASIAVAKNTKQHIKTRKATTWANILTQEQDLFLKQLKQSSFYKNFESPAKSVLSEDLTRDENFHQVQEAKENAEQNIFNVLENKVSNASFNSENSFIQRFFANKVNQSGDETPVILERCVSKNPQLLHLFPPPIQSPITCNTQSHGTQDVEETQDSAQTECEEESSSSESSCSCKTVEEGNSNLQTSTPQIKNKDNRHNIVKKNKDSHGSVTASNDIQSEMAEMNAKLIATSELLKDRLNELESEIEVFRHENSNLVKLREEFDLEKQKFYNEKASYEQKYSEDKILSEYFLAEEKEKLAKQKQVYDRYIREMRGQLMKKDKDEVLKLKKEMEKLKEEYRTKEAKSTSCIARLRNQIKSLEREKNEAQEECEKLKKEMKRSQQINTTSRRLSNLKYLTEINKKLEQFGNRSKTHNHSEDTVYRTKKSPSIINQPLRVRAKSVPNLAVTSRYAKYFSQRDAASQNEREKLRINNLEDTLQSDGSSDIDYNTLRDYEIKSKDSKSYIELRNDNNLEKSYTDKTISDIPTDRNARVSKSGSDTCSTRSKSPIPSLHLSRSNSSNSLNRSGPSLSSHRSSISKKTDIFSDNNLLDVTSAENIQPRVSQTNLNPTEIKRPDGTRELRFPNGNIKILSSDGKTSKFIYYNGDIKETFYDEGKIKYYYAETQTHHTTYVDGLEVLQFPDGQVEKRYPDGSVEIRLPNGSMRYTDPRNKHVTEEWRFPDGTVLTVSRDGEQVVRFPSGQVEVHAKDHKRREYPDGTVKLVYNDGTSETRYASGRVRIKDSKGTLIMDSAQSQ